MAAKLPYVHTTGTIKTVLGKIIEARTPERFTQDFLETKLGAKGGSARAIIPLLKRIGMLQQDGSPTEIYRKFRNTDTSGAAMAQAIRHGYAELFERNEYAHELEKPKILELVNEISGKEKGNSADGLTVSTFLGLKEFAEFNDDPTEVDHGQAEESVVTSQNPPTHSSPPHTTRDQFTEKASPLALAYSINLHLPETDDIKVFDAIFQSLNNNILKRSDG